MGTLMGLPMIFLTTTGRVSNKPRTTPLTYLKDNDDFICVASFGGYKKHPDWYLNLQKNNRLKPLSKIRKVKLNHLISVLIDNN